MPSARQPSPVSCQRTSVAPATVAIVIMVMMAPATFAIAEAAVAIVVAHDHGGLLGVAVSRLAVADIGIAAVVTGVVAGRAVAPVVGRAGEGADGGAHQ